MKIGIIREGKVPIDKRVALIPAHAAALKSSYNCEVVVQPSAIRAITDEEYVNHGIALQEDVSDCDVLFGVKEVPIQDLIPNKTYFFFSHTYKQQPYNAKLLRACVDRKIRLIDYELLKKNGNRVVAFGRFAGLVGAYNGLRGWGEKYGQYALKPAHECRDMQDMFDQLKGIDWPADLRILLTGKGRVASGAVETLVASGIPQISPEEIAGYEGCFWSQLDVEHYYKTNDGRPFDRKELFADPSGYESDFMQYVPFAKLFIAGHYYDSRAPFIFTREDAKLPDFAITYVADISCDIDGPVASTLRASTIADPFYGYLASEEKEVRHDDPEAIGVMAVDNLPCELPRDASLSFGNDLMTHVIQALFDGDKDDILYRATECENGVLTKYFEYLQTYIDQA
ncbi:MAG: NAD(P)-dependent oxidoreductase [Schleiferiaceae bacterium]|nr:NAD(P)-dependent oxidoreductase [Schleiferiaceae bacterium]